MSCAVMNKVSDELVRIAMDDLPKYSPWPKRLLSQDPFPVKNKTEKEVLREFEDEKWGRLLKKALALENPSLLDIEEAYADTNSIFPCYEAGNFYLATWQQMHDRHVKLYADFLGPHVRGASCLVELGAGYGSKLFALALRDGFSGLPLFAGEYAKSGRDLISILAKSIKRPVTVGYCDFRTLTISNISIPPNAVIFTSYAAHYVPRLSNNFVDFLARLQPKAVVHFEPCYEHYDENSLHGMMCRRYVELNDYTRNLAGVIDEGCKRDGFSVRAARNVLGNNPFLPISVIEWAPAGRSEVLQ
jgi:hypothetical protein